MKTSVVLKQERAAKFKAQKELRDKASAEKREKLSEEETTQFRALQGEIDTLDTEIEDAEKFEETQRKLALSGAGESAGKGEEKEHDKLIKRYSLHRAINAEREGRSLDGVEKEIHDETVKRAKSAGIAISGLAVPTAIQKRFAGQSVTQDSGANGAAFVDTEMQAMIDFLRPKPVLETLGATYMTGLSADVKFPVNDGGIAAYWEGEVDAGVLSKNTYTNKTMKPKRLAAGVPLSIQNIIQSSVDLEALTLREINAVMANALDIAAINGSGASDQPLGILNAPGTNVIAIGTNGGALTWPHIVDMESKVFIENANSAMMAYLINPVTKGKLKVTKHEAGDLAYLMAQDNTINGYNVGVNNLVPGDITKGTGTNLSAAIFGDFSQVLIGQWGFVDLTVDKSSALSGYFTLIVNAFYDVLVRQPKAFTVIKDISNA
jgi:HK97 family phage major capsid protein